jgi:hypothetical protein
MSFGTALRAENRRFVRQSACASTVINGAKFVVNSPFHDGHLLFTSDSAFASVKENFRHALGIVDRAWMIMISSPPHDVILYKLASQNNSS